MWSISVLNQNFKLVLELVFFNNEENKWNVKSRDLSSGDLEIYACNYLIFAKGENNEGYIPKVGGIENFEGEIIHSSDYKIGQKYEGKNVLIVGSGNSGMEIAFDLSNYGVTHQLLLEAQFMF